MEWDLVVLRASHGLPSTLSQSSLSLSVSRPKKKVFLFFAFHIFCLPSFFFALIFATFHLFIILSLCVLPTLSLSLSLFHSVTFFIVLSSLAPWKQNLTHDNHRLARLSTGNVSFLFIFLILSKKLNNEFLSFLRYEQRDVYQC